MLYLAARLFHTRSTKLASLFGITPEDGQRRLHELTKALQVLKNGNNLARDYLTSLETGCFEFIAMSSPLDDMFLDIDIDQLDHLVFSENRPTGL